MILPEADERERTPSGELRLAPDDTLLVEILPLQWLGQERVLTMPDIQRQGGPNAASTATTQGSPPADATPIVREEAETASLERLIDTFRRGNPYRVSRSGTLDLPGLAPIPVAGLTAVEATHRLTVEELLQDFRIRLTLLPLEPTLKPFGHDIFENALQYFPPTTTLPVPVDYVVGPGDRFEVQLIGTTKGRYSLVVNRNGSVMFPELGPIAVSGLGFEEVRAGSKPGSTTR